MRRLACLGAASALALACASEVTVFSTGSTGAGGEAGGGQVTQGGPGTQTASVGSSVGNGGGTPDCYFHDECAVDAICFVGVCDRGTCAVVPSEAGTPCGEGAECDGGGNCLLLTGKPCTDGLECQSGLCVDGFCCDSACTGDCESCDLSGAEGICSPTPAGAKDAACGAEGVCDGAKGCVSGVYLKGSSYGAAGNQVALGLAVDAKDNVVVTGYFAGSIAFGATQLTSAGQSDVYLAKLDDKGAPIWAKRFGGVGDQFAYEVATDAAANIALVGYFGGSIDFGGGTLTSAGAQDAFVAKLDPDGAHLWSKRLGDAAAQEAYGIAVGPQGEIAITGSMQGTISIDGVAITSAGSFDAFVIVLEASGSLRWAKRFGDAQDQRAYGVAIDPKGHVVVTGRHFGSIDFGAGALVSVGERDAFVAKLDGATGAELWAKNLGGPGTQLARAVACDADGNVAVVGRMSGSADLGGGTLTPAGGNDVFLVKLDPNGAHLFSARYGDAAEQEPRDVRFDAKGRILLTGFTRGAIDFGGGPKSGGGFYDAFIAKLTSSGAHLWSRAFGGGGEEWGYAIGVDSAFDVWLAGFHTSNFDLGGGPLVANGGYDAFVLEFAE